MSIRLYTPLFAFTLLISAALLFSVQPMFSKMILPLLGGTPQVWNTAMLFFQVCLLGGYAYAHGTSRYLSVHTQSVLHIILLGIFAVVLPFAIPEGWVPPAQKDPTLWQLSLMAITVGGPFFVLAGSAPMLQRWFAETDHPDSHNPYFLYGASNLGSMASLLAYPVLIEPFMNLPMQSESWMYGYFGLIAFTFLSAALVWRFKSIKTPAQDTVPTAETEPVSWGIRLRWIFLAFIPSSLMLGVTTYITTDIASVPLLWILPLAIYVGTFILVFARKPLLSQMRINQGFDIFVLILILQLLCFSHNIAIGVAWFVALHMCLLFFAAMVCHNALAAARPHAAHLTEFYLLMSLGGALGGFFNAIITPQFFILPIEYALMLSLAVFIRFGLDAKLSLPQSIRAFSESLKIKGLDAILNLDGLLIFIVVIGIALPIGGMDFVFKAGAAFFICSALMLLQKKPWLISFCVLFILFASPMGLDMHRALQGKVIYHDRNFFGVIKVFDIASGERIMMNGTTDHGRQVLKEEHKLEPISYYSKESPLADVYEFYTHVSRAQEIAVIGLGAGCVACYRTPERHFDFFEIDPKVVEIAENEALFTFLSDCGSPYDVIIGDGRMTIAEKPDKHYDIIHVDAFSSDNIPVHIMTKEAVELYLRKLKDDGALIMHVSNNYLDLEPVVTSIAEEIGIPHLARVSPGGTLEGTDIHYHAAHGVVLTRNEKLLREFEKNNWGPGISRKGVKTWTDDYSNIVSVIGNKTVAIRHKISNPELYEDKAAISSP